MTEKNSRKDTIPVKSDPVLGKHTVNNREAPQAESVKSIPPREHPWGAVAALLYGFFVYFASQIATVAALAVYFVSTGQDFETGMIDEDNIGVNFALSFVLTSSVILLTYLYVAQKGGWHALKLKLSSYSKLAYVFPAYGAYFFLLIISFALIDAAGLGVDLNQEQELGFEAAAESAQLLVTFIALVIFAPISEEILFRGFVFQGLRRSWGGLVAAVVSSGLFALVHFQLNVGIDTFLLGLAACWLVVKTDSIVPAILLHMIKNAVAFTFLFLVPVS